MAKDTLFESFSQFFLGQDHIRENLNKYTRKAFQMLPELEKPRILDIGCGTGVPTIELARLSDGEIIGIDINQSSLDKLNRKIKEEGLSNRVRAMKCSLLEIDFPDETFDVIWSEGSIHVIGFEKGLKEWKRLIKENGFLVVHDEVKKMSNKLKKIPDCGYELVNHFLLPEDAWLREYYEPLENRIKELCEKYHDDPEAVKILEGYQKEMHSIKKNPEDFISVFYVMQKL